MPSGLTLILSVALAFLAARLAFDWLARRFMLVSGVEYLLLGILLGPQVSGVLSAEAMAGFAPLITLALGWIGAIVGMQFYLPALMRIHAVTYRLAFLEALGTLCIVGGTLTYFISWVAGMTPGEAALPGLALGAIAAVSAPAGIEVVTRRSGTARREPLVRQLQVATAVDALVGIITMGLLFGLFHPGDTAAAHGITPTEWMVITIGIGLVGGSLFHLFLGTETNADRLFISMGGAIVLVSGAAAYLHLSPVLAAMVVGATLANTSRNREQLSETLARSERPFYYVLLIFAGASWHPSGAAWWWLPVILFLVARVFAKIGMARLAARVNDQIPVVGGDWGLALVGQGGLALALGLDYSRFGGAVLPNIAFSAAIASVVLTDAGSARLIHWVMSRLPEVRLRGGRWGRGDLPADAQPGALPPAPPAAAPQEESHDGHAPPPTPENHS